MSKRLLDVDPFTGLATYFEHDEKTGTNTVEYVQDVESHVDRSRFLADGLNKKEEWWPVGHIPDTLILQWAKECNAKPFSKEWSEYATKQLNKREYSKFNQNRIKL